MPLSVLYSGNVITNRPLPLIKSTSSPIQQIFNQYLLSCIMHPSHQIFSPVLTNVRLTKRIVRQSGSEHMLRQLGWRSNSCNRTYSSSLSPFIANRCGDEVNLLPSLLTKSADPYTWKCDLRMGELLRRVHITCLNIQYPDFSSVKKCLPCNIFTNWHYLSKDYWLTIESGWQKLTKDVHPLYNTYIKKWS